MMKYKLFALFMITLSVQARFTQVDPHWAKYPSFTPYNYAANNPLKYVDPDGKDPVIGMQIRRIEMSILAAMYSPAVSVKCTLGPGMKASMKYGSINAEAGYSYGVYMEAGGVNGIDMGMTGSIGASLSINGIGPDASASIKQNVYGEKPVLSLPEINSLDAGQKGEYSAGLHVGIFGVELNVNIPVLIQQAEQVGKNSAELFIESKKVTSPNEEQP